MQTEALALKSAASQTPAVENLPHSLCRVIRRNGQQTAFDPNKIALALTKAFLAVEGNTASDSSRVHDTVDKLTTQVVNALFRHLPEDATVHIENIQDQVELALMRSGEQKVARAYVLYREQHAQQRANEKPTGQEPASLFIVNKKGQRNVLDKALLQKMLGEAVADLESVDEALLLNITLDSAYDGMDEDDLYTSLLMSARSLIDKEPNYSRVSARLLLQQLRREALDFFDFPVDKTLSVMTDGYADYFKRYIKEAVALELLDDKLLGYDLDKLAAAILPERDYQFDYLGLQTLYDRYFIHQKQTRIEMPQAFFMRVAMGLAINEVDREQYTIEFYLLLSSFDFMCSTPTLFNSATNCPQLSSCYLTTVPDDLDGIYSALKDNAMLSKFAGGLGNDWTRVIPIPKY